MSKYIRFNDAVMALACEMFAEAQACGYDPGTIEDFIPEAKSWMEDAPCITTKRIKYFDEEEKVWKIGEVIVEQPEGEDDELK